MKKCVIFLFSIFSFLNAWEDYIDYKIDYIDKYDSLKQFPPRLRGFGDENYFNIFIKPQLRDSLNVRLVGRWPFGPGFEVYGDTSNNILCFGSGSGVLVFDITDPSNPIKLSQICVNGLIMQIFIRDSLLFVSSYGNGVEIYNIADPINSVKVSQINVPARDFCLKDTFAYCVAEDSLRIINIADILSPYQVGACWDSSYTISISGNYVYTGGRWKLSVIDVSNPANPTVVNFLSVWVYTLTCDGNHCYCVLNTNGFTIYNISDPLNIWQESQLNTVGGVDIYKLGFYVYLPGFMIVDVGDSANPFVVGDTSLPVYAQAVWVNDNFGYGFVANDYVGLTPININDPTNPSALASIYGADDSRDVFVLGDYAYVSNSRKGLKIIDVADPSIPYEVGEYDTVGARPDLESVWVRDSIVYMAVSSDIPPIYRFKTVNISNPSSPQMIGQCASMTESKDIFVKDTIAYFVGGLRVFNRVNIVDPTSPETLPIYILPDVATVQALFLQDTFAYIADGDSGLRILNISDPSAPFEVGYFMAPEAVYSVFVKDTLAYFAALGAGLRIVKVADPSNPQEISFYMAPGWTRDVWVVDTIAYVAASGCVEVLDVSNPVAPTQIAYYNGLPQSPRRIFYNHPYLFYASFESGMGILEWYGTGIEESGRDKLVWWSDVEFRLRPTVVSNVLHVTVYSCRAGCAVVMYDAAGRKVMDIIRDKEIEGKVEERIDVFNLATGVYFVVLEAEDKELVKKIVVIH